MHKKLSSKGRITIAFITTLLLTTFFTSLLPKATATPVTILSISPKSGHVGDTVRVIGEIDTLNGSYTIFFDDEIMKKGTAIEKAVDNTFIVPSRPMGSYNVTLHDTATKNNATEEFTIETAYFITAVAPSPPIQLQEGMPIEIWVNITGGTENTHYRANITVSDSSGAVYYNDTLQLTNTMNDGCGEGSVVFPTDFGTSAHTNYTGIYHVTLNESLATGDFPVGLTDRLKYRRTKTVHIRGAGYNADETVTINIATAGIPVVGYPKNVMAGADGVVTHLWTIPENAIFGTYTVTLTNATTTVKPIPDVQNFTVAEMTIVIEPTSGPVGTTVTVVGKTDTQNGSYRILWDGESAKEVVCDPGSVTVKDTFAVPPSVKGSHNVTLYDVTEDIESTPSTFEVTTSYHVSTEPARIQEGLNTTIIVSIHGAEANITCALTINVTDPANRTWAVNRIIMTDETGSGNNATEYWGEFVGANTDLVGNYSLAVNATLATGGFTVGLTDKLEYRRAKYVNIRGSGYKAKVNETVTIDIAIAGVSIRGYPKNKNATNGVVIDSWPIPGNATLGIYTVALTNATVLGTVKPVLDIQNFTVIEITVHCQAQNRYDREPLAGVDVRAYVGIEFRDHGITNKTGWIYLRLDRGSYTFRAYWKNRLVGSLNGSVIGNLTDYVLQRTFYIECELAHLTIAIKDETGLPLPFINVNLTSKKLGTLLFETNSTGIIATNTFTNASYTIESRRYGHLFDTTLIENLTSTCHVNITCPAYNLFIYALDSKEHALKNVQVTIYEWSSGRIVGSGSTDSDVGSIAFGCTFGRYKVRVYNSSRELGCIVVLNETVIDLTEDSFFFVVHCMIFNVDVSVRVVDHFGQPVPNAVVKLERQFEQKYVNITNLTTGSDGTVPLPQIGGDYRISVHVMGECCEIRQVQVSGSKIIEFKIDKYVMVGGYPFQIVHLMTYISLLTLIAVFALAIAYGRLSQATKKKKASQKD